MVVVTMMSMYCALLSGECCTAGRAAQSVSPSFQPTERGGVRQCEAGARQCSEPHLGNRSVVWPSGVLLTEEDEVNGAVAGPSFSSPEV